MTVGRVLGILAAVVMLGAGIFLTLAGLGYLGASADKSQGWATLGPVLAGLGVALVIVVARPPAR